MLIGGFVAAQLIAAAVLAAALEITKPSGATHSYADWFRYCFLQLFSVDWASVQPGLARQAPLLGILGLLKIVIPSLFLGGIVFKLLNGRRVMQFSHPSFVVSPQERYAATHLARRLYNRTKLLVVDVRIRAFLRIGSVQRNSPVVKNMPLEIRTKSPAREFELRWPIALPHVPFTVYVPLRDGDVAHDDSGQPYLTGVQTNRLGTSTRLLVLVNASVPQLGSTFTEEHWYDIPQSVKFGRFTEIDVDVSLPARQWKGWDDFDR